MREPTNVIRDHLLRALDWEDAHVEKRGAHAEGFEDILDFCVNAHYEDRKKWPDDYWPKEPAPPSEQAWHDSIAAYKRSLDATKQLTRDVDDLTATVPADKARHTYLREILLVVDHNAYHLGQVIDVRRALRIWR